MQTLTPCQLRLVNAVARHSAESKLAPTIRELARSVCRSTATVHEQIRQLRLKGWLTQPSQAETVYRAIRLTDEAKAELGIHARDEQLERECRLLAKLAARTPQFDNPLQIYEAEKVRDKWLAMPAGEAVRS
jgi:DNA-binding MarR family transcriptional regulator